MSPSAEFVVLFIRGLAWDADDRGISLADALKIAGRGKLTTAPRGKLLVDTPPTGAAVEFMLPPLGGLRERDLRRLCGQLLGRIEAMTATVPGITSDAIYAHLLAAFNVSRSGRRVA